MAVIVQIIDDGMHDDVEIARWFELSPEEQMDTLTHVSDDGPEIPADEQCECCGGQAYPDEKLCVHCLHERIASRWL